jgi:hypothetical protein
MATPDYRIVSTNPEQIPHIHRMILQVTVGGKSPTQAQVLDYELRPDVVSLSAVSLTDPTLVRGFITAKRIPPPAGSGLRYLFRLGNVCITPPRPDIAIALLTELRARVQQATPKSSTSQIQTTVPAGNLNLYKALGYELTTPAPTEEKSCEMHLTVVSY